MDWCIGKCPYTEVSFIQSVFYQRFRYAQATKCQMKAANLERRKLHEQTLRSGDAEMADIDNEKYDFSEHF